MPFGVPLNEVSLTGVSLIEASLTGVSLNEASLNGVSLIVVSLIVGALSGLLRFWPTMI